MKPRKLSKLPALLKFDASVKLECERPHLIGLDEVGRGSMIGPIVAGAVRLPETLSREQKTLLSWLDDSKKLKAAVRAELCVAIREFCAVGLGAAEKDEVDRLNVHHASLLALHRAFEDLCANAGAANPDDCFLLVDGRAPLTSFPAAQQRAVIKGDGTSAAIAAASILAKETRDQMVIDWAAQYPGYGWESNMGYGTAAHLAGLRTLGITPLHRQNYKPIQQLLSLSLT